MDSSKCSIISSLPDSLKNSSFLLLRLLFSVSLLLALFSYFEAFERGEAVFRSLYRHQPWFRLSLPTDLLRFDAAHLTCRSRANIPRGCSPSCSTPGILEWVAPSLWTQHLHGFFRPLGFTIGNLHSSWYLCRHTFRLPWILGLEAELWEIQEFPPTPNFEWQCFSNRPSSNYFWLILN